MEKLKKKKGDLLTDRRSGTDFSSVADVHDGIHCTLNVYILYREVCDNKKHLRKSRYAPEPYRIRKRFHTDFSYIDMSTVNLPASCCNVAWNLPL